MFNITRPRNQDLSVSQFLGRVNLVALVNAKSLERNPNYVKRICYK